MVEETRLVGGMQDGYCLRRKRDRLDVGQPSLLDYEGDLVSA